MKFVLGVVLGLCSLSNLFALMFDGEIECDCLEELQDVDA